MKSKLLVVFIVLVISMPAMSQGLRINGYAAYAFEDKVDSYYDPSNYYSGTIKSGFQWGAGLEFMMRPNQGVELSYQRMDTHAPMHYYKAGEHYTNFELNSNYIMLGSNRYFSQPHGKVEGFLGGSLGMAIMGLKNPENGASNTKEFFAWGLKGGCNIWASDVVGIKLQAQLLSAVQSVGGGFYFGTGGAGAGVSSYSSMYQFSLGGGLVFKLPSHK